VIARDVVILGAGPAGLAAAAELKRLGLRDIAIIDREAEPGGIPRHCGHLGFGLREFRRLLTGPQYARRIAEAASTVSTGVTALQLETGGTVHATGPHGGEIYRGKAVLLALGARETPRSARLVSGTRPWGVMNTGALQQFVYLHRKRPFQRPVVIGTELVSFSALMTMRHLGIRPAAMIEAGNRITARRPGDFVARAFFGVPIRLNTQLLRILGKDRVEGVEIDRGNGIEQLDCDGVIFTGKFRPENALLAESPVAVDHGTLGPSIDQYWRCSDPAFFAAGNLLRGIETAGQCWREGRAAARTIAASLDDKLPVPKTIPVQTEGALKYVYPQRIAPGDALDGALLFKARVRKAATGTLAVRADDKVVWSRRISALPERRIAWPVSTSALQSAGRITVALEEA
jgi:NADPH-dependent 2,4-dienoyl-CoA reductase/sulfur reductase-like enzyme